MIITSFMLCWSSLPPGGYLKREKKKSKSRRSRPQSHSLQPSSSSDSLFILPDLFDDNIDSLAWILEDDHTDDECPTFTEEIAIQPEASSSSSRPRILQLPDVIFELVCSYLPRNGALSLASTCTDLREFITSDVMWKPHYWSVARQRLALMCLPADYNEYSSIIEDYRSFPDRLFERHLEIQKEIKLEKERYFERCRKLRAREAIRVKFQKASPQVMLPACVLFIAGCVVLTAFSLLERTADIHFNQNTYRYVTASAIAGLFAMLIFLCCYAHYAELRYYPVLLMALTQCGGFITAGSMMLFKAISHVPYSWIHCGMPLIVGIIAMLFVFVFDFFKTLKSDRVRTRQKIGDFASMCIAPLPLTVTVLLGTSSLSCHVHVSCCLKVFWPILFVLGILLPWPPFYAIHWIWNSRVRHWRRDFFPCVCFYLLYVIAWTYIATMCSAFCFAPTFGLTLLTILLSFLLIFLLLGWEFAIANGSSFL
eukprot:TRINITY_DN15829_c0_g1_i2.p1 TRINITY_DN15829_c0_g1~~TRINITY_DN15829_c0_g1_i2.p1  ORF type:complete len:482 (+),score=39.92 TRINITY_DN15829_c0_g1_i2:461-1906(+)